MRKLSLAIAAFVVLLVASFVSPVAASEGTGPLPIPRGPHGSARAALFKPQPARIPSRASASVVTPAITCDGQFHYVSSPNGTGTGNNYLSGISAVSANDVWAVGNTTSSSGFDRTLAEHWNGTSWTKFATVNTGSRHNDLLSVSAESSNDVWAVGFYQIDTLNHVATIAQHWNGTTWTKVPTINPSNASYLFGVTAISSNDVWAVGLYYNSAFTSFYTLIEHYNGTAWTWTVSPNAGTNSYYNQLSSVSGLTTNDVWAVGTSENSFTGAPFQPLALHWDGVSWTPQSAPAALGGSNEILGVTALEAGHAVAVGYGGQVNGVSPPQGAVWDLEAGAASTGAGLSSADSVLNAVGVSGDGVWAVGYQGTGPLVWPGTFDITTHTLTWAGSPGTADSESADGNDFFGVAAISPSVFWAAGFFTGTVDVTLTEVQCDLKLDLAAPATAAASKPFSMTVTAQNPNNTTKTRYRGTVHFASSDSQAVLPADYTFIPGDAGVHTFAGVVLKDSHHQPTTITVSDVATPFVNATVSITVSCIGSCQSPSGTPGARSGSTQSAGAAAGGRGSTQSAPGAPGPRIPGRSAGATRGARLPAVNQAVGVTLETRATTPAASVHPAASVLQTSTPVAALKRTRTAGIRARVYAMYPAARIAAISPAPDSTPWYVMLLLPLFAGGTLVLFRLPFWPGRLVIQAARKASNSFGRRE